MTNLFEIKYSKSGFEIPMCDRCHISAGYRKTFFPEGNFENLCETCYWDIPNNSELAWSDLWHR